ncbi:MAG: sulfatase-like hydrolase/transferase [Blastocatellia bacterium]|nr:sulfatase-like hydrolase/transferase [Blastocatellia bacterium]
MPSSVELEPLSKGPEAPENPTSTTVSETSPTSPESCFCPRNIVKAFAVAGLWAGVFFGLLEAAERNLTLSQHFLHVSERLAFATDSAFTALGFLVIAAAFSVLLAGGEFLLLKVKALKLWQEVLFLTAVFAVPTGLFCLLLPKYLYDPFVNLLFGLADKGLPLTTRLSHHHLLAFGTAVAGGAFVTAVLQIWLLRHGGLVKVSRKALLLGVAALFLGVVAYWADGRFFVGHYEDTFHNPLALLQLTFGCVAMLCFMQVPVVETLLRKAFVPLTVAVVLTVGWAGFRFDRSQNVKALLWRRSVLIRQYVALIQKSVDFDGDGFSPILGGGDADDRNPNINPLAADLPQNGVDENGLGGDAKPSWPPANPELALARQPETIPSGSPKRNVLFLSIDALRADHLGCYGYGRTTSPNLDRFASRSLLFLNSYSQASNTGHSFSSIMTSNHGEGIFDPESPNLATTFRQNGWDCVFLSKRIMGDLLKNRRWSAYKSIIYRGMDADAQIKTGRKSSDAQALTDKVIEFMKQHSEGGTAKPPFYAWVHLTDPHARYLAHSEFNFGQKDLDLYDGEIAYTDFHLGRLFSYMETSGLLNNTIVIITADHGEAFGEHGEYFHGSRPYREQARVPLIVRAPGVEPHKVETPVASLDIAPTALNFVGVAAPPGFRGVNLLQFARMQTPPTRILVSETPRNLTEPNFQAWGITDTAHPEWRMIYDAKGNTWELYNLKDDPQERQNLIDERPTEAARLKQAFGEWMDRESQNPHYRNWSSLEPSDDATPHEKRRKKK